MRLLLLLTALCACGKIEQTQQSQAPVMNYQQLAPSVENCQILQNVTATSPAYQLTGYASGIFRTVEALRVKEMNQNGMMVEMATQDLPFGTYCNLHITNGFLSQVTMSDHPGCSPGWGMGCKEEK